MALISCKTFLQHFFKDHRKCWGEIMCRASWAPGVLSPNHENSLFFISAIITASLKVTGFNPSNEGWQCDCLPFYIIVWNVNVGCNKTFVTDLCVLSFCSELLLLSARFLFSKMGNVNSSYSLTEYQFSGRPFNRSSHWIQGLFKYLLGKVLSGLYVVTEKDFPAKQKCSKKCWGFILSSTGKGSEKT